MKWSKVKSSTRRVVVASTPEGSEAASVVEADYRTTLDPLKQLHYAYHPDFEVVMELARNPNLADFLVARLAVFNRTPKPPATPEDEQDYKEWSAMVRAVIAAHPKLQDIQLMIGFLNSVDADTRENIITNPSLPTDLLVQHLERLDPENVQADRVDFTAAQKRMDLIYETGNEPEPEVEAILNRYT